MHMTANLIYGVVGKEVTVEDLKDHKRVGFLTNQSDLLPYNGKDFEIVRSLNEGEADLEVAPMFKIKFADGFETDAFMDEIYAESLFEVIQEANLVRG
jgi:hypothetical protein